MALESFYGGKPGFSPVIKAKFKYIDISDSPWKDSSEALTEENKKQIMNECFKDPNYKDVWYGELCIIDSENKLDLNNGKLFRRTLKKVDDAKNSIYAEYLGQISGPAGGVPKIHVGSINSEIQKALGNSATYDGENVANLDPSKWDYSYINSYNKVTSVKPENENDFGTINALTEGIFVPGNESQEIQYTWCNVRRNDEDHIMYLGFKIPYTVFDIDAKIENYTYNGSYFEDKSEGKPFWKKYTIHVPRGVRGIGPEEIKWVNKSDFPSTSTIYTTDAIIYQRNEETGIEKYSFDGTKTITRETLPSKFWVGLWKLYNQSTDDIKSAYIYLGEYKAVEGFELSTDGYISVRYSDGVLEKLNKDTPIKWISSTTLSPDSGFLTLIHNTKIKKENGEDEEEFETTLLKMPMIRELWIDPRGHLLVLYPSSCRPDNGAASNSTSSNSLYPELTANVEGLYNERLLWVKGTSTNKIAGTIGIWWHDLGLVYKVLSPKIATSFDAENVEDISSSLNSKYPNGVIKDGDGNITVSEGGMIAVENVPSSDGQTTETRIYYYNYEKGSWQDLGPYTGGSSGGSGNNSNVRIEGYSIYRDDDIRRRVSEDNLHILYPKNSNSEIHFGSSEMISKSLDGSVIPSGEVNDYEVLGYGTSLFSYTSNERSVVGTAKVGEANVELGKVSE